MFTSLESDHSCPQTVSLLVSSAMNFKKCVKIVYPALLGVQLKDSGIPNLLDRLCHRESQAGFSRALEFYIP